MRPYERPDAGEFRQPSGRRENDAFDDLVDDPLRIDCHDAQNQQDSLGAMQPSERRLWPGGCPAIEKTVEDEGLAYEQDKDEQQPHADHGVHPPELN